MDLLRGEQAANTLLTNALTGNLEAYKSLKECVGGQSSVSRLADLNERITRVYTRLIRYGVRRLCLSDEYTFDLVDGRLTEESLQLDAEKNMTEMELRDKLGVIREMREFRRAKESSNLQELMNLYQEMLDRNSEHSKL
ncbi:unnamed protein product [Protopolystoma xenopodis]|uniref:Uncharacterized protein n=1 Tax=Protopolystoma xenopodis TaxID=117903 RepID=A0A448WSS4_9PLAT|nr:unnamed protein product [Protopolystoma xenopodis]